MVARIVAAAAVAGLLLARPAAADPRPRPTLALTLHAPTADAPGFASPSTVRAPPGFLDQLDLTHPIRVGGHVSLGPPSMRLRVDGAVVVDGDIPGFATTLKLHTGANDLAIKLPLVQVSPGLIGGAHTWEVRLRVFSTEF